MGEKRKRLDEQKSEKQTEAEVFITPMPSPSLARITGKNKVEEERSRRHANAEKQEEGSYLPPWRHVGRPTNPLRVEPKKGEGFRFLFCLIAWKRWLPS